MATAEQTVSAVLEATNKAYIVELAANPKTESTFEVGSYGISGIVCNFYAIGK